MDESKKVREQLQEAQRDRGEARNNAVGLALRLETAEETMAAEVTRFENASSDLRHALEASVARADGLDEKLGLLEELVRTLGKVVPPCFVSKKFEHRQYVPFAPRRRTLLPFRNTGICAGRRCEFLRKRMLG